VGAYLNILSILRKSEAEPSTCEGSREELIEQLIDQDGWEPVRDGLFKVLLNRNLVKHGYTAAAVLWGAVLDQRPLDPNYTIAVLERQRSFRLPDEAEDLHSLDTLVWSITIKLKGLPYLSDYDPTGDPAVKREMDRLP